MGIKIEGVMYKQIQDLKFKIQDSKFKICDLTFGWMSGKRSERHSQIFWGPRNSPAAPQP